MRKLCVVVSLVAAWASGQWVERELQLVERLSIPFVEKIAASETDARFFVEGEDSILVIDGVSGEHLAAMRTGRNTYDMLHIPETNRLYCATRTENAVTVHDLTDYSLAGVIPTGIHPQRFERRTGTSKVYCMCSEDVVSVIDASGDSLLGEILLPDSLDHLSTLVYATGEDKLYVFDEDGRATVVDCQSDTILTVFDAGQGVLGATYSSRQNKLHIADYSRWSVVVIDCHGDSVLAVIDLERKGIRPRHMVADDELGKVYAVDESGEGVAIIDARGDTLLDDVWVLMGEYGPPPLFSTREHKIYAQGDHERGIFVFDTRGDTAMPVLLEADEVEALAYNSSSNLVASAPRRGAFSAFDCSADTMVVSTIVTGALDPTFVFHDPVREELVCYLAQIDAVAVVDELTGAVQSIVSLTRDVDFMLYDARDGEVYGLIDGREGLLVADPRRGSTEWRRPKLRVIYEFGAYVPGDNLLVLPSYEDSDYFLEVIDAENDSTVGKRGLPKDPVAMAAYGDDGLFCVASERALHAYVTFIDIAKDSVLASVQLETGAAGLAVDEHRGRVYTTGRWGLSAVDVSTFAVVGHNPDLDSRDAWGLCCDTVTGDVYLARNESVLVIDPDSLTVVAALAVPGQVRRLMLNEQSLNVYCFTDSGVAFLDCRSREMTGFVPGEFRHEGVARDPARNLTYVPNGPASILVIGDSLLPSPRDSLSQTIAAGTVMLPAGFSGILYDALGRRLGEVQPGVNDISHFRNGMYFVRRKGTTETRKVILTR